MRDADIQPHAASEARQGPENGRKAEAAPPKGFATSLKAYVSLDNLAVFRIDGFLRVAENKIMSAL